MSKHVPLLLRLRILPLRLFIIPNISPYSRLLLLRLVLLFLLLLLLPFLWFPDRYVNNATLSIGLIGFVPKLHTLL